MSTTTANLGLFKYDTTNPTDLAAAFNINTALNNNWDIIDNAVSNSGSARNIGEIVASTIPLTDAGLHLLDGALISGSGVYSAFVTYIAGLRTQYSNLFTTESAWQTAVSTYGVCGKFVYDSTNNTVRLPKVTGIIEGTTDVTALGDLVEAGLPNIEGKLQFVDNNARTLYHSLLTGCFSDSGEDSHGVGNFGSPSGAATSVKFDASLSSSIYGNSTTVQPQTIKAFYYIVIATSSKTDIQVDIDEIATDLNGKVDISDLSEVQCIVETYQNGTSWYRVYSDGWCEQGGYATKGSEGWLTISLLKSFVDTNYNLSVTPYSTNTSSYMAHEVKDKTTSNFAAYMIVAIDWQACGYIGV